LWSSVDQDTDDDRIDPDELDIDCVVENNEGTWFAYPHFYMFGRSPAGPHAQAVNTEVCNIVTGYTDLVTDACAVGCGGNSKTIRTWTILDWCTGEFIYYEQIIKVVDDRDPELSVNDISVSVDPWKCSKDVLLPHPEHLFDNCDDNLVYEVIGVTGGHGVSGDAESGFIIRDVPLGTTTVTVQATDCCGNFTKRDITITVEDNTPPVPVTRQYIVTSLTNIGNPVQGEENGISKIHAADIDNGSYDSCTPVVVEIRREGEVCDDADLEWGDFVSFCCADLGGMEFVEIDVQFRVVDRYGNENIGWATVRLEDKSNVATFCPPSMIVTCDMDLNNFDMTGFVEQYGACGPIELMIDTQDVIERTEPRDKPANTPPAYDVDGDGIPDLVPEYNKSCGFGAIRRQFRSSGATVCEQWFVVEPVDIFDPNTIQFPVLALRY